jgi:cyclohexa-1,5-dienecarbonyl-CoA hydratase
LVEDSSADAAPDAAAAPRLAFDALDDGRILVVRLNAPPGNVLDLELVRSLRELVAGPARAPALRALVFTAAGPNFSFGASIQDHLPDRIGPFLDQFHGLFRDLIDLSLPLVAAVHGRCLGGGLELAAFCQRVVAGPTAELGQPEIGLGVFAPIASLVLPWRLRGGASDELLLTGRIVGARDALALGLVDEIADAPAAAALAYVRGRLLPKSASALRLAVRAARASFHARFLAQLDQVDRLYREDLMKTPDAVEGIRAFLEKRPPRFQP